MEITKIKQSGNEINVKVEGIEKTTFVVKLDEIETKQDFINQLKAKVVDYNNELTKKQDINDKFNNLKLTTGEI